MVIHELYYHHSVGKEVRIFKVIENIIYSGSPCFIQKLIKCYSVWSLWWTITDVTSVGVVSSAWFRPSHKFSAITFSFTCTDLVKIGCVRFFHYFWVHGSSTKKSLPRFQTGKRSTFNNNQLQNEHRFLCIKNSDYINTNSESS